MKIDYEKLKLELIAFGLDEKRSIYFCDRLQDSFSLESISASEAQWALQRGFLPDRIGLYGLNNDNYKDYLSDLDYFAMHPLNNHFRIWVNDKLTLKYMLSDRSMSKYMPEYYLYIENDGHYTYLVDSPKAIAHNESYLISLLKEKKCLACKPNNGAGGKGFIKLEWIDNTIYCNGEVVQQHNFQALINRLNGYIVTEYVRQHAALDAIYKQGTSALRIVAASTPHNEESSEKYRDAEYKVIISYIRFVTAASNCACNLTSGGVGVPFDYETGRLSDRGVRYKHLYKGEDWKLSMHPDTKACFGEIVLPLYEEVKECVENVCRYFSSLDYFGFDIMITDTGVKLCEINTLPAMDYEQVMCGPALKNKAAKAFYDSKRRKQYPEDSLWRMVEKCVLK